MDKTPDFSRVNSIMLNYHKKVKSKYRRGSHTTTRLRIYMVWVTKYRYKVLKGNIQKRCREIIRQGCETLEIEILK